MVSFKTAAKKTPAMSRTANGMVTFQSTGNALLDFFSSVGSSRGKNITPQFNAAYEMDREKALKILLWARDIRGGAGERQVVRDLLVNLEETHPEDAEMLIPLVPFFGRWDDLFVFKTKEMRQKAYSVVAEGLDDPATAGLVAKWCHRKGKIALELEEFLGLRPTASGFHYTDGKAYPGKAYRQKLVGLTHVVENLMCKKAWDDIVFDHVPSLASARYQKAFNKRCAERYKLYKEGLVKGTAKINAAGVYPYDVIKSLVHGDSAVAKAQWEALPNFLGDEQILAVVDVSGSMGCPAGGYGSKSVVRCIDVATSLGLYVADKARGPFKDCFLTFSGHSKIEVLKGDIVAKHAQMCKSHWDMNTNVESAFDEILRVGKTHKVADEDMPRILLILSDMEFDQCVSRGRDARAMDVVRHKYEDAGYKLPRIVFWNINARSGNAPVYYKEDGTALVSGFSPAIMKSVLKVSVDSFTPENVMLETINNPRYDVIDKPSRPTATAVEANRMFHAILDRDTKVNKAEKLVDELAAIHNWSA